MTDREQAIVDFVRRSSVARPRDLTAQGFHPQEITRLVEARVLQRGLRHGYMMADHDLTEWHEFAEIAKAVPKAVFHLISALSFHGIGTQLQYQTWIALPKGAWTPRRDLNLRVTHLSEPFYSTGIEEHIIEGVTVKVYCAAKTVADCFRMRSKVGYDVAIEALREGWRERKFTLGEVMNFAKIDRVDGVIRPYLESLIS